MKLNLKLTNLFCIAISLIFAMQINAQQRLEDIEKFQLQTERNARIQLEIDAALKQSPSAVAIHNSTGNERSRLLGEAVRTRDMTVIPYLSSLVKANWDGLFEVEIALVRLGEVDIFEKIVRDVQSEKPNERFLAISKLAHIKSKESYRRLFELLEQTDNGRVEGDSIIQSTSEMVMDQLSITVEDPPKGLDRFDKTAWKAWFERNRHLID